MRKNPRSVLPFIVHVGAWIPLIVLVWQAVTGNLTVNPVQAAIQRTGKTAFVLLVLSLTCTPLNSIFNFKPALKVRRALGLYAFLYAAGHFLLFSGLDYAFNLEFILADVGGKPYIWVGLSALIILTALAVTSFAWWKKRLGKNWKRLHRLVYLAGVLVALHYAWAKKGDLFTLSGDILQPFLWGLLILVLLAIRIPFVKRTLRGLVAKFDARQHRLR